MNTSNFSHKYKVGERVFVVDNSLKPRNDPFTIETIYVTFSDKGIKVDYLVVDKYSSRRFGEKDIFDNELDCKKEKEKKEQEFLKLQIEAANRELKQTEEHKIVLEKELKKLKKQLS